MSWYIIEGPDDTGKTTLAKGLERRGWMYQHCDQSDELPILARRMAGLVKVKNVVWDRAHLGEMVHHPERVDTNWSLLIETLLHALDARCVLLVVRHGDPEEWENTLPIHNRLTNNFQMAAGWSGLAWGGWPDPMPKSKVGC
jgi:hypothetical protein